MPDLRDQNANGTESVDDAKDAKEADPHGADATYDETQREVGERAQQEAAHDREAQKGYL